MPSLAHGLRQMLLYGRMGARLGEDMNCAVSIWYDDTNMVIDLVRFVGARAARGEPTKCLDYYTGR
jgi:hypothetical protein